MQNWWTQTTDSLRAHLGHLRVAVYASGGAPSHHLALLALWGGQPRVIHAEAIVQGGLEDFDAVIFPGGGLLAMAGQLGPLGEAGVAQIRAWIEAGGSYIGTCAGSCHPLKMSEPYRAALPVAAQFQMCSLTPVNAAAGEWGLDSPGTGRIVVEPQDHPLFAGFDRPFEIVHYNGPLFPAEAGAAGRVIGATTGFTPFESSAGLQASSTTLGRAIAKGACIAYRQRVGQGQIILFGSHPEFGASALQLGWLRAARLLANALSLVPARGVSEPLYGPVNWETLSQIEAKAGELEALLEDLSPLGNLLPADTPPFLGYSGPELWQVAVSEARQVLQKLQGWAKDCPTGSYGGAFLLDSPPKPNQDFGFTGVRQLLYKALEMTRQAAAAKLPQAWPAFSGAYNEFLEHPYHLVASVYLSAAGLVAGAGLQATAFAALNALSLVNPIPLTSYERRILCRKNAMTDTSPFST